jgi:hypothetical protein
MSASEEHRAEWLDPEFWERLDRLEGRHLRVQSEHESARRGLDRVTPREAVELRQAGRRSGAVIDELDKTTAEFEILRTYAG